MSSPKATDLREGSPPIAPGPASEIREGPPHVHQGPASNVRRIMLGLSMAVAVLLYLDRYCLSTADRDMKDALGLSELEMSILLGAFFVPYAFAQLPFGYLADRHGARRMLSLYMVIWSIFTGLTGFVGGFSDLLLSRLGCGLFEAGAYPACAGIIKRWIPLSQRGFASAMVSFGGRLGGAITPKLTVFLMAVFAVATPEVASWRPVILIYGVFGILLAMVFFWLYRDRPELHPRCNPAEQALIGSTAADVAASMCKLTIPWRQLLTNHSLWISSAMQFGVNFGWVFLLTYFNRYLEEVHHADRDTRGTMSSLVLFMSVPALPVGGWLTDWLRHRIGLRWGRALPMAGPRFVAASLYAAIAALTIAWSEPTEAQSWTIVVLFGVVAFCSDVTLPAIWAFSIDIGGRRSGIVLGWSNMWGNLGAAVSPFLSNQLVEPFGWVGVFWLYCAVFTLVGIASLFIDAREVIPDESAPTMASGEPGASATGEATAGRDASSGR